MSDEVIANIVSRAETGEYDLPEIQRQFVWKREQVSTLCDSLFNRFPVGSLLLWDSREYREPQAGELGMRNPFWLVDGQQRVSALCVLFGRQPRWWDTEAWAENYKKYRVFLNIPLDKDEAASFGRPTRGDQWISLPVDEILSKAHDPDAIALARDASGGKPGLFDRLSGPILQTWNVRNQTVPVLTLDQEKTPEEVAEVFRRLNEQGTRVRQTDTRLVYIAAYNPGWVRTQFYSFLEERQEEDWDIDPGHVLQSVMIYTRGKARVREIEKGFWKSEVTNAWGKMKDAIEEAILRLWDNGVSEIQLVPSDYTLIPLFALQAKFGGTKDYSFDELFRWFILANLSGRYAGAALEMLSKDAAAIYEASTLDEALQSIAVDYTLADLKESLSINFKKGSPQALLIHVLLWQKEASDWIEKLSIPALAKKVSKLEPHWHHILPKAWARRNSFEGADDVGNVTLICARTNVKALGSSPPWEYVPQEKISLDSLREHFIPERFANRLIAGKSLNAREFKTFRAERCSLIASEAADYLGI